MSRWPGEVASRVRDSCRGGSAARSRWASARRGRRAARHRPAPRRADGGHARRHPTCTRCCRRCSTTPTLAGRNPPPRRWPHAPASLCTSPRSCWTPRRGVCRYPGAGAFFRSGAVPARQQRTGNRHRRRRMRADRVVELDDALWVLDYKSRVTDAELPGYRRRDRRLSRCAAPRSTPGAGSARRADRPGRLHADRVRVRHAILSQ